MMGAERGGDYFFFKIPGHLVMCNNVEPTILQVAELT